MSEGPEFDPFAGDRGEWLRRDQARRVSQKRRAALESRVVRALCRHLRLPGPAPRSLADWHERHPDCPDRPCVRRAGGLAALTLPELFSGRCQGRWQSWLSDAAESLPGVRAERVVLAVGPVVGVPGGLLVLRRLDGPGPARELRLGWLGASDLRSYLEWLDRRWPARPAG